MKGNKDYVMMWLDKILEQVSHGLTTAGQFLEAELPLFVKEYLLFTTWWYIFAVIGLTVLMVVIITVVIWAEKHVNETGFPLVIGGIILIPTFLCWIVSIHQLMLVTVAPRVFLLKEFAAFFK